MQEAAADRRADAAGDGFGAVGRFLLALSKNVAIAGGLVFVGLVAMSHRVDRRPQALRLAPCRATSKCCRCARLSRRRRSSPTVTWRTATSRSISSRTTSRRAIVARLDAFGSFLVGAFGALLAWRTAVGALAVHEVGETSAVLAIPIWIAQALMVPGFALLAVAGFYMCVHRVRLSMRGAP